MRGLRLLFLTFLLTMLVVAQVQSPVAMRAAEVPQAPPALPAEPILSDYWNGRIQQWSPDIAVLASAYGVDADLIAAIIEEESDGDASGISHMGAVGLMGVMPSGPGLEWRPSVEQLTNPATNLRWGVAILAEIMRQSGGDLSAALAAYNGGWDQADERVPQEYATRVLDGYARAVVVRNGLSPDIASQWTIGISIRNNHVPTDDILLLGERPVSGQLMFGEHTLYNYVDQSGRSFEVQAYAVPVALVVPMDDTTAAFGTANQVDAALQARLDQTLDQTPVVIDKVSNSNPRVLIACLPSLSRLRGRVSTRWYAPSDCPSWHR